MQCIKISRNDKKFISWSQFMFSSWSTLRDFFIFFWLKSVLKGLWIFVWQVLNFVGQFLIYGLVSNWHNLGQSVNKQSGQIGLTCYWILFYYFSSVITFWYSIESSCNSLKACLLIFLSKLFYNIKKMGACSLNLNHAMT